MTRLDRPMKKSSSRAMCSAWPLLPRHARANTRFLPTVINRAHFAVLARSLGLCFILALGGTGCGRSSPTPDSEIRASFFAHSADFLALKDMIGEEKDLLLIGDDSVGDYCLMKGVWRRPPSAEEFDEAAMLARAGLSRERYAKYLELLKRIGAYRVTKEIGQRPKGEVAIHLFRAGTVRGKVMKDVVFMPLPRQPIVEDTDDYASKHGGGCCYSLLDGNWYIEWSD